MKYTLIITFCFLSLISLGQTKEIEVKQDTVTLTHLQLSKLSDIEKKIQELQQAQKELLTIIFDARGFDIDKVRELKFENGKFIFITTK